MIHVVYLSKDKNQLRERRKPPDLYRHKATILVETPEGELASVITFNVTTFKIKLVMSIV